MLVQVREVAASNAAKVEMLERMNADAARREATNETTFTNYLGVLERSSIRSVELQDRFMHRDESRQGKGLIATAYATHAAPSAAQMHMFGLLVEASVGSVSQRDGFASHHQIDRRAPGPHLPAIIPPVHYAAIEASTVAIQAAVASPLALQAGLNLFTMYNVLIIRLAPHSFLTF